MKELNLRIKKIKETEGFRGYIVITQDCIPISSFNVGEEEAGKDRVLNAISMLCSSNKRSGVQVQLDAHKMR